MFLQKVTALNFGPISEANIDFGSSQFVILYGENNVGKSTLTGTIFELMKTKGNIKSFTPLKAGEKLGLVEYEFEDKTKLSLELREEGSTLKMTNPEGKKVTQSEMRERLKELVGEVGSFDINKYINTTEPAKLKKMISELIPDINFDKINQLIKEAKEWRRVANADLKRQEAKLVPFSSGDALLELIKVGVLDEERRGIEKKKEEKKQLEEDLEDELKLLQIAKDELDHLEERVRDKAIEIVSREADVKKASKAVKKFKAPDLSRLETINQTIKNADETNEKIRRAKEAKKEQDAVDPLKGFAKLKEGIVVQLEQEKADMIAGAKLPVEGMTLDKTGEQILLNGFPLGEATNKAAKVIAGLKIKAQELGELKFLHIDFSSLDWKNMREVMNWLESEGIKATIELPSRLPGENGLNVEISELYFEEDAK